MFQSEARIEMWRKHTFLNMSIAELFDVVQSTYHFPYVGSK
jgi:hypothetical protein